MRDKKESLQLTTYNESLSVFQFLLESSQLTRYLLYHIHHFGIPIRINHIISTKDIQSS